MRVRDLHRRRVRSAGIAAALAEGDKDEIRIGQTLPYSGPLFGFGIIGRHRRLISRDQRRRWHQRPKDRFISLDDAYSPPRRSNRPELVEQEEVLLTSARSEPRLIARGDRYLKKKKVPQLRAERREHGPIRRIPLDDAGNGGLRIRRRRYAKHILRTKPDAKIAILSQNDDFGRDYVAGFKRGLVTKRDHDRFRGEL